MTLTKKSFKYIVFSIIACILSFTLIMVSLNSFYLKTVEKKYNKICETTSQIISAAIDENSVNSWLKGENIHRYIQISSKLKSIKSSFNDIDSISIYQMKEDGMYTVFRSETDNPRFDLGNVESYNSKWAEHKKELLSGKSVDGFITNGYSGNLEMICVPLFDSNNNYVAHICIGISIDRMNAEIKDFTSLVGAAIFAGIAILYILILTYVKLRSEKLAKANIKDALKRTYAIFFAAFILLSIASVGLNAYEQRNKAISNEKLIAESTLESIKSIIPRNRVEAILNNETNENYNDLKQYAFSIVKESSNIDKVFINEMQKDKMRLIIDTDNAEDNLNTKVNYPDNLKTYINDFIDGKSVDTFVTHNKSNNKVALAIAPILNENGDPVCYLGVEKTMTDTNKDIIKYMAFTTIIILVSLIALLFVELTITAKYLNSFKED